MVFALLDTLFSLLLKKKCKLGNKSDKLSYICKVFIGSDALLNVQTNS